MYGRINLVTGKHRPPIGLSPLSNQLPHFDFSIVSKERQSTLLKSSFCIVVAVAICPWASGITIVMAR